MKEEKKLVFLLLSLLLSFSSIAHDYYITIFEVNLSKDEKSLQISAKFIAHDVEEAIMKNNGQYLNLSSSKEHPKADSLLVDFLKKNVSFKINGTDAPIIYDGKEVELDEDLWLYFEIPITEKKIKTIDITNTCLIAHFPNHQNIMHVSIRGQLKSYVLTKDQIEQQIQL